MCRSNSSGSQRITGNSLGYFPSCICFSLNNILKCTHKTDSSFISCYFICFRCNRKRISAYRQISSWVFLSRYSTIWSSTIPEWTSINYAPFSGKCWLAFPEICIPCWYLYRIRGIFIHNNFVRLRWNYTCGCKSYGTVWILLYYPVVKDLWATLSIRAFDTYTIISTDVPNWLTSCHRYSSCWGINGYMRNSSWWSSIASPLLIDTACKSTTNVIWIIHKKVCPSGGCSYCMSGITSIKILNILSGLGSCCCNGTCTVICLFYYPSIIVKDFWGG